MQASVLDFTPMEANTAALAKVRAHYLFAGLSPADFDGLAAAMTITKAERGKILFLRGDPAEFFYYVVSGQVELALSTTSGEKKILEIFGPGRTFAEAITFMRRKSYPASAQILDDAEVVRVPNQPYIDILNNNSDACLRLLGDISQHLHARVIEIERSTVQDAKSRLLAYLMDQIEDPSLISARIELQLPRHALAARLSIKPETLSRILRALSNEKLIEISDRTIYVPDVSRLHNQ